MLISTQCVSGGRLCARVPTGSRLSPLPGGLAFLGERARALTRVLGGHDRVHELGLVRRRRRRLATTARAPTPSFVAASAGGPFAAIRSASSKAAASAPPGSARRLTSRSS